MDKGKIRNFFITDETGKHNCGGIKKLNSIFDLKHFKKNGYKLLAIQSEDVIEFWIIDSFFTLKNYEDFIRYFHFQDFVNFECLIIEDIKTFPFILLL